jgi:hypothetical protein
MTAPKDDDGPARSDREAIMARRQRFVAAALAGLTTSMLPTACRPQPCLRVQPIEAPNDGEAAKQASPREPEAAALADVEPEAKREVDRPVETPPAGGWAAR